MLISIISPAKNILEEPIEHSFKTTTPSYLKDASILMDVLKEKTPKEIGALMKLSEKLSVLNYNRNQDWNTDFNSKNSKPAIYSFNGDVYKGIDVQSLKEEEINNLNQNTLILSGLYGILKPLDLMKAYRLEMGTKLENNTGKNLYTFWKNKLGKDLQSKATETNAEAIINLASNEYFKAINTKEITSPIWTPIFKDLKNDNYKIISFYAKKARGLMVRFITQNKVNTLEELYSFNSDGYYFSSVDSSKKQIIFHRDH